MLNQFEGMGRLVADPEVKKTNSGKEVVNFTLAIDRDYVKKGEERATDFIPCIAWEQKGKFVANNFKKGNMVAVVGQLQSNKYTDKEGKNRTSYSIQVEKVSFTGERRNSNNSSPDVSVDDKPISSDTSVPSSDGFQTMPLDDDLPF